MLELRPSNAERWMNCPGSAQLIDQLDLPDYPSYEAAEGTAAHELAAWALTNAGECQDRVGDAIEVEVGDGQQPLFIEVDEKMASTIQHYVDTIDELRKMAVASSVEQELDLSYVIHEGATGTADAIVLHEDGTLRVTDLKYGQGVQVSAEHNKQLMIYALGALDMYEALGVEQVVVEIYQPRMDQFEEQRLSLDELEAFREQAREKADQAINANSPDELVPDAEHQCKFCPAARAGRCPAFDKLVHDVVFEDIASDGSVDLAPLSIEALGERRKWVDAVKLWIKGVTEGVHQALEAGHTVPGWALAPGRAGNRRWSDEEKVADILRKSYRLKKEEVYNMKLISPPQAEKILSSQRWDKLQDQGLVERPEGGMKVVRADEYSDPLLGDDFDDIT